MLRALIHRRLDVEAERLGASMDYLKHIVDTSLSAFFTFMRFMPMARRRRVLPEAVHAVAHLTAARAAACGACVQIGVTMARRAGVPSEAIRAVLEGRSADLPAPLDDVAAFARAGRLPHRHRHAPVHRPPAFGPGAAGDVPRAVAAGAARAPARSLPRR